MKLLNFSIGLIVATTFIACGGDDNGGGGGTAAVTTENIVVLSRGSGGACVDISGRYNCTTVVDGETSNTSVSNFTMSRDNQNRQILNQNGIVDLIMDGNIHETPGSSALTALGLAAPKYSIDCNGDTITIHNVGDEKTAFKMTFTKTANGHLSGTTHELLEGVLRTETGACSPATIEQIENQPAQLEEANSGFGLLSFIISLFS